MDVGDLARAISALLDPVVETAGFAPAQFAFGDGAGLTFCAASEDLRISCPWLLPWVGEGRSACTDLVVQLDPLGRICTFDLEFTPVDEVLRTVGHGDAADPAAQVIGVHCEPALPLLVASVRALCKSSTAPNADPVAD